jgi:hypothetical protein
MMEETSNLRPQIVSIAGLAASHFFRQSPDLSTNYDAEAKHIHPDVWRLEPMLNCNASSHSVYLYNTQKNENER